ncbi:MAG: Bug family tripartite tricarboxylate transporter substrate binding protein [Burkholderiales bacterium]
MAKQWCCMAFLLAVSAAQAQPYPGKPIRLILPDAAGGGFDVVARALAVKLSEQLGYSVVVDNRGGAGGALGAELAMQAAPDGYTIAMFSASSVIRPLMYPSRYDVLRDFVPVSQATTTSYVLLVNPALPVKSVGELVAYAKANSTKLSYASAGQGSLIHLATELMNSAAGIKAVHVPYKGMGAAYPDLIGGQVQMAFASIVSALPHARSQRLRALAVSGATRAKAQPDLPTVAEAGIPGYEVSQWYAVFVPARTPPAIVDRLNREIVSAVQHPDVAKRLAFDGAEPVGGTSEQLRALVKTDLGKWARVIKDNNIRGD